MQNNTMSTIKRLLITILDKDGRDQVLPVNTGNTIQLNSEIGEFGISVYIKDFDGCQQHRANSLKNFGDGFYLNGDKATDVKNFTVNNSPNLRILFKFTPSSDIKGSELMFGNDCPTPVRDYIPTTLLSTGIRFFSWFINPTITQDIYCDEPYLYGLALNSFTKIASGSIDLGNFFNDSLDNLEDLEESQNIPKKSKDRCKYFCKKHHAENFTFRRDQNYLFLFDTNFVNIGNSEYNVAIPTYKDRTFNISVLQYANENLNNFNWTVKQATDSEKQSANLGNFGVKLNFRLIDEH